MKFFVGIACAACAMATSVEAQTRSGEPDDAIGSAHALFGAIFVDSSRDSGALTRLAPGGSSTFAVRSQADQAAVAGGAFATPAFSGTTLDTPGLLTTDRYLNGQGLVGWRTGETVLGANGSAVDSLRLSVGGVRRAPIGTELSDEAFDLTYSRGWLSAVRGQAGDLVFDVTPHAGLGVGNAGGSAQLGAVLRVAELDFGDQVLHRLNAMGVPTVTDGSRFGDRGRWYLFAAGSGRAVGLNMMRNEGGWSRQGVTTDEGAFIGEAQVGLGWRKGDMQASFGVVHREIKHKPAEGLDETQVEDQAVAFTLSIKPRL
jgi:hypothetical protein